VAIGFTHLLAGALDAAATAFTSAISETPDHPRATVGLYAVAAHRGNVGEIEAAEHAVDRRIDDLRSGDRLTESSLVAAGAHAVRGQAAAALAELDRLLSTAPAGPAGWIIPVDPMLQSIRADPGAARLLAKLAARAA
jgi:hypothetical protein